MSAEETQAAEDKNEDEETSGWWALGGVVALLAVAFGIVMLAIALDPGEVKQPRDPSIWELLLGNRTTILVLRLGLFCVVGYLGWSLFMLIKQRKPLSGFGGFTTGEIAREAQGLGEAAVEKMRQLEDRLAEANANISFLTDYSKELEDDLQNRLGKRQNPSDKQDGPV